MKLWSEKIDVGGENVRQDRTETSKPGMGVEARNDLGQKMSWFQIICHQNQ